MQGVRHCSILRLAIQECRPEPVSVSDSRSIVQSCVTVLSSTGSTCPPRRRHAHGSSEAVTEPRKYFLLERALAASLSEVELEPAHATEDGYAVCQTNF
jgi:hypothetical protein